MSLTETLLWALGAVAFSLLVRRLSARLAEHMRSEAERFTRPSPDRRDPPEDDA